MCTLTLIIKCLFTISVTIFWLLIRIQSFLSECYSDIDLSLKGIETNYDYIIVGAGTAGSILALRLSQNESNRVLLIESGPYGSKLLDIPSVLPLLQTSQLDWQYETTPQQYASRALKNNVNKWPRGKLFGGSAMLNNMIYLRGDRRDYEEWFSSELSEFDYSWDVLQYFRKSNEPLYVNQFPFYTELSASILQAAQSMNYPIRDLNDGKESSGFMKPEGQIRYGARYTTSHHLKDNQKRNLRILVNREVIKINFLERYEAVSVLTDKGDLIRANKGIVLSAGTINTAKLLMLSGIGPKNDLIQLGIDSIVDLPVGRNLQDHVTTGLDLVTINREVMSVFSMLSPYNLLRYIFNGQGPWTSSQADALCVLHSECIAAANFTECTAGQQESPDLQLIVMQAGVTGDKGAFLRHIFNLNATIWNSYFVPLYNRTTISIIPVLLHPKSRGYIQLKSKHYWDKPYINPNYLAEQSDVDVLIAGIQLIKRLTASQTMRRDFDAQLYSKSMPGCEQHKFDSHSYWDCYIRHLTLTAFHPIGTASIGSVIDRNFRVIGVNRLYVADASAMPTLTSANINAAVGMLAEKAAANIIRDDFQPKCMLKDIFLYL